MSQVGRNLHRSCLLSPSTKFWPLLTVGAAIGTGRKRGVSPVTPYSIGGHTLSGSNQVPGTTLLWGCSLFASW